MIYCDEPTEGGGIVGIRGVSFQRVGICPILTVLSNFETHIHTQK